MELHRFFRYAIEKMCKEKKSLNHFSMYLLKVENSTTNSLFHTVKYKNHSVGYIFHTVGYKSRTVKQRTFSYVL